VARVIDLGVFMEGSKEVIVVGLWRIRDWRWLQSRARGCPSTSKCIPELAITKLCLLLLPPLLILLALLSLKLRLSLCQTQILLRLCLSKIHQIAETIL
jgi:hypothetical protein